VHAAKEFAKPEARRGQIMVLALKTFDGCRTPLASCPELVTDDVVPEGISTRIE
jgi:hypothetical protein